MSFRKRTDVALETAGVALIADDLSKLEQVFHTSRRAQKIIRQNLWLSVTAIKETLMKKLDVDFR